MKEWVKDGREERDESNVGDAAMNVGKICRFKKMRESKV